MDAVDDNAVHDPEGLAALDDAQLAAAQEAAAPAAAPVAA